ncbi:MAG: transketolase C-terminal domain-containing protein, partial [Candidatus Cryptobacteroides sp.]
RSSGGDFFEAMGFRYFGPIDGNDIDQVVSTLHRLKNLGGPLLLHTITKKGKGYAPAEENQTLWHAPGLFDPETGKRKNSKNGVARYQDVFGRVLLELAKSNPKIVGITPAMASGCGMNLLASEMPERFYDVGIEEEHAVTFSAGLAANGMKPFCNIYSSFSQRAYDQIIHDVALQKLGVVLCFDRGGLVGEDGATHHGCYDMAAYRSIPGAVIAVPRNEIELKNMMYTASLAETGPFIIRYPRGGGEGVDWENASYEQMQPGKAELLCNGEDLAVVAAGPFANRALDAAIEFAAVTGKSPAIYNIRYIKPIDGEVLDRIAREFKTVLTIEDGCVAGGLFGAVSEYMSARGCGVKVVPTGIPDRFISQGTQKELRAECGLDKEHILALIREEFEKIWQKTSKSFGE